MDKRGIKLDRDWDSKRSGELKIEEAIKKN